MKNWHIVIIFQSGFKYKKSNIDEASARTLYKMKIELPGVMYHSLFRGKTVVDQGYKCKSHKE